MAEVSGLVKDTMLVLTDDPLSKLFSEGGSGHWVAEESRVRECDYLVAVTKREPRKVFVVGRGLSVARAHADPRRLLIQFAEYAVTDKATEWRGQNPVRYADIRECGIQPSKLTWLKFPASKSDPLAGVAPLTIDQAKRGLAKALGISPDKIEISIRA
jgi:hypothetical protein